MADEEKRGTGDESAEADAAHAEADPSSVVEPSNEELAASEAADEDFAADLRDGGESADDTDETDERVPEPVGVGSSTDGKKASRAPRKSAETARKDKATPKRDGDAKVDKRTGPITFVKESVGELRKVVYPTGPQLANYFVVVLIFVLFIILIVSLLDLGLGSFIFWAFSGA